jgi:predicted Zn-dependent protease with MMP-like domain
VYSARGRRNFEKLVHEALEGLPPALAMRMSNVDIVIEDAPSDRVAEEMEADPEELLGVYQGIPLTERSDSYFGVLPDRIALFKKNIERIARSKRDLQQMVRRTVIHEVAHHFGIDDDKLEELGWD